MDQLIGKLRRISIRHGNEAVTIAYGITGTTMVWENDNQLYGGRTHHQYQSGRTGYQQVQDVANLGDDNQLSAVGRIYDNSRRTSRRWLRGVNDGNQKGTGENKTTKNKRVPTMILDENRRRIASKVQKKTKVIDSMLHNCGNANAVQEELNQVNDH